MLGADVVDAPRLEVAADAPGLDVDDAAGTEGDRVRRTAGGGDRLVEADRRPHGLRELRVAEQVLLRQGLLDEEEVELVELREPVRVLARVGRVRVDLERDVAEALADRAHRLDVRAGLDLQLDAPVPLLEMAFDREQEVGDVVVDPDRDAAVDLGPHGAEELAERRVARSQLRVEDRHLHRRLRHRMAAHGAQDRRDVVRLDVPVGEQAGEQVRADDVLRAVGVLGRVVRPGERDALAPALGGGGTTWTSRTSRWRSVPREVRNGATSGSRRRRSSTDSILIGSGRASRSA